MHPEIIKESFCRCCCYHHHWACRTVQHLSDSVIPPPHVYTCYFAFTTQEPHTSEVCFLFFTVPDFGPEISGNGNLPHNLNLLRCITIQLSTFN